MKAEQFINEYTMRCSNELCAVEDKYGKKITSYHEWVTSEQALNAVKIAKEETIEKACKWLKEKTPFFTDRLIYLFRKAMED